MRDAGKAIFSIMPYKFISFRGGAPDPAEEAHDTPPDPLVVWVGRPSLHLSPRRLQRLAFWEAPSAPI